MNFNLGVGNSWDLWKTVRITIKIQNKYNYSYDIVCNE